MMDNQNIQKAGDNAKQIGQIGEASSIDFGSITIEKNANGSAVISGNDNRVVIYQYQIQRQVEEDQLARVGEIGPNPYKGLLAFQETDGDHFFGRSEQIKQLWRKFRSLHESDSTIRLLPIYGPSGSGKSSLARAGLIPELARQPLPGYAQAQVKQVIARFSAPGARLITLAANANAETAEVTHEALFEHWRQLQNWLDGSRSDIRFQRRLDDAAVYWDENGRPSRGESLASSGAGFTRTLLSAGW